MPGVFVNRDLCNGCGACKRVCPVNVFDIVGGKSVPTRAEFCMACGLCEVECPARAIAVGRPVPVGAAAAVPPAQPQPIAAPVAAAPTPPPEPFQAPAPPPAPVRAAPPPFEPLRPAAFEPRPVVAAPPPSAPAAVSPPPRTPAATPAPSTTPGAAPSWPTVSSSPPVAPSWPGPSSSPPAASTAPGLPSSPAGAPSWPAAPSSPAVTPSWPGAATPAAPSPVTSNLPPVPSAPPSWPSAPSPAPAAPPPAASPPPAQETAGWGYFGGTVVARGQETPAIAVPAASPQATLLAEAATPDGRGHKMFIAVADLCTGCRLCEMMCALKHTGVFNPYRAAIKVTQIHEEGLFVPNICRHCKNPPACQRACPVAAITTDPQTQVAVLDHAKCINCLNCVYACPFGAIPVGPNGEVYKCDLCGGDPICVKYCPKAPANSTPYQPYPRASCLQYVDAADVTLMRRMADVERKTKEGAGAGH